MDPNKAGERRADALHTRRVPVENLISTARAAQLLGATKGHVRYLIHTGQLSSEKVAGGKGGAHHLLDEREVLALAARSAS